MNNQVQLLQELKTAKNDPRAYVMSKVGSSNPILRELIGYAEQGRSDKIEEFARNYCKEHGIDFDKQVDIFKSLLG